MTDSWAKPAAFAETTDPRDYFRPIWAHKILILVLVAAATVGTYLYYDRQTPVYESSAQIFVGQAVTVAGVEAPVAQSTNAVANQARLLRTIAVARRVAERVNYDGPPEALLGGLSVTSGETSDFLTITVRNSSPQVAATLADNFAQAFIDVRAGDRREAAEKAKGSLEARLAASTETTVDARSFRRSLRTRINELELAQSIPAGNATQIDSAFVPGVPLSPNPRRNAIFAFALSLLLGVIVAFGLERIDRRLRDEEDAGATYGLPVIATVREDRLINAMNDGIASVGDPLRESFRSLRSNLDLAANERSLRSIVVTSAIPEEGKSAIVRNLGLVYAEAGLRVVILEGDLRRPSLARSLGVNAPRGLSDVLMGLASLEEVQHTVRTHLQDPAAAKQLAVSPTAAHGAPTPDSAESRSGFNGLAPSGRLTFIPSGPRPSDPPAMFAAPSFGRILDQLVSQNDIVLIDSPPLLAVSDAIPLLSLAEGTLMVCRLGTSTSEAADRVVTLLKRVPDARMLGLVVNGTDEGDFGERYKGY